MSTNTSTPIVALSKTFKDPVTKAALQHHVLIAYNVRLLEKQVAATFASYVEAGAERPVAYLTATAVGEPSGDTAQWLYEQIVAGGEGENPLFGAALVRAESTAEGDATGAGEAAS